MSETQIRLDTQAQDGTLIDSKIAENTITLDKLASIGDGKIIVGAVSTGYPTAVTTTGDVAISGTGATTIQSGAITGSKIASATITNTNLAAGDFSAVTGIGAQDQVLNMNSHKINSVTDPSSAQDAATKNYVDTTTISATLPTNDILIGNLSNVATAVSMSGDVSIDHTGATTIQANTITDSKVSATAAINITKLNTGTNTQIIISDGSTNHWESLSGDVIISNTGVTTIGSGVITDAKINSSANIALSKLADGNNILLADTSATIQNGVRYTYSTAQSFTNPGDLIDKAYVDATASGLNVKQAVRLATTSSLVATYNNGVSGIGATLTATSNGALFVDGFPVATNDRILVKNQVDIPLTITSVATGVLNVTSNTGVIAGDPIGQALLINITSVSGDGVTLNLTSSTGIAVGDTITQGAASSVVATIPGGTSITVVSNSGFTAATAIDATQFNYYNTYVTSTSGSTIINVSSSAGFYAGSATDIKAATNGIYIVTQTGSASLPYILTRSTDFNGSIGSVIVAGDFVFVSIGTVNGSTGWVANTQPPYTNVVWGVTEIDWLQFSSAGVVTAGSGLQQVGSVINVVSANGGIVVNAHNIALTLADSTLSISGSGLSLASLPSGDILVGNGSNVATAVAMSGAVTISNTGVTTISSSYPTYSSFVTREVPTGSINSSNRVFTLANVPVTGTECIFLNGLLQTTGVDYTISGATITFESGDAPETGSILVANYQK